MKIVPHGRRCRFQVCPVGLFLFDGGHLGMMTEYSNDAGGGKREAYVVESGEYFWGGASTHADRARVMVQPCRIKDDTPIRAYIGAILGEPHA